MLIFALLIITTVLVVFLLIFGLLRLYLAGRVRPESESGQSMPLIQVLVPIKGCSEQQETVLSSLLQQDYPSYKVSFIIEDETDGSSELLHKLSRQYDHAEVLISGRTELCGQKNHGLSYASGRLHQDVGILVTCDGNSIAQRDWLTSLSRPIRNGRALAVTTFRTFNPRPVSVAGVCQAIYGSMLSLLIAIEPKPWGGSTAIKRQLFDLLDVRSYWSRTVVDDLVMGNLLMQAGIRPFFSPVSVMETPLASQTFKGFLSFLHRQILFPKFTNPGLWLLSMVGQYLLASATAVALLVFLSSLLTFSFGLESFAAFICLVTLTGAFVVLHQISPHRISLFYWLVSVLPFIALATYVYVRSLFVNYIDWSGKRYYCGRLGVVTKFESLP